MQIWIQLFYTYIEAIQNSSLLWLIAFHHNTMYVGSMAGMIRRADQFGSRPLWLPQALKLADMSDEQFEQSLQMSNATAHELVVVQMTQSPRFEKLTDAEMNWLPGVHWEVPRSSHLAGGMQEYQEKCNDKTVK